MKSSVIAFIAAAGVFCTSACAAPAPKDAVPDAAMPAATEEAKAAEAKLNIGFSGMEMYKLDFETHNLRIADINGDGLNDIVVANDTKARIDCLIQRKDPSAPLPPKDYGTNELPDDRRFISRPLITEKKVYGLAVGDLNGDGRNDLAYYGDPKELVVQYQDDKGEWGARRKFDIRDGATTPGCIAIADINGDGRNDVILMATDGTYFITQDAKGVLQAPVKEAGLPQGALAVSARDVDGDGKADLAFLNAQEDEPFSFRFQTPYGGLGPEIDLAAPPVRSAAINDLDGDGHMEIAAIQQLVPRLVVYKWVSESTPGSILEGAIERYALRSSARKAPVIAAGDFIEAGRTDLLVADAESAEIAAYIQTPDGAWQRRASYPTIQGITDAVPLHVEGNARPGLLVLSPDEPMLGVATFDEKGQLKFPRALSVAGKPVCVAVDDINGDGKEDIVCGVVKDSTRSIKILLHGDGDAFTQSKEIALKDPKADPDGILVADVNQDGIKDLLVFFPYQEMRVLKGMPNGDYTDVSFGAEYGKTLVQGVRKKSVAFADVNGNGKPELIITSKNFARALKLDENDKLIVVEQFNGRSPQSQIAGIAVADLTGDGNPEIILVDSGNRCLTALKRSEAGAWEIAENLDMGQFNFNGLMVLPRGGKQSPAILIAGANDFNVLRPGSPHLAVRETASFETAVPNGQLALVKMANLAGDSHMEIIVTEATESLMAVLVPSDGQGGLRQLLSWPIFESKIYGYERAGANEPREFDIADLTNDGKPDIALLIHDRVIVYVQE